MSVSSSDDINFVVDSLRGLRCRVSPPMVKKMAAVPVNKMAVSYKMAASYLIYSKVRLMRHRLSVTVLLLPLFVSLRLGAWRQGGCVWLSGDLRLVLDELSEDVMVSSRRWAKVLRPVQAYQQKLTRNERRDDTVTSSDSTPKTRHKSPESTDASALPPRTKPMRDKERKKKHRDAKTVVVGL